MRIPGLDEEKQEAWQPLLWTILTVVLFVLAWVIAFIVENTHTVAVHWVFATTRTSLIWVIVVSALLGLLVGVLLSQLHRRRWRRRHAPPAAEPAPEGIESAGEPPDAGADVGGGSEAEREPR